MILLSDNHLIFKLPNGESVLVSADTICVDFMGDSGGRFDTEFIRAAASAVFHYFKNELQRDAVTVGEFSQALEKVLTHLGYTISHGDLEARSLPTDLDRLARESGDNLELFFFPRLRQELRGQLSHSPRVVRFHGLRGCVKTMAGARRWNHRCELLQDQIVSYLRECLNAEKEPPKCALLVQ